MGLNLSLNQKSLPLLGLDISASAVKLVELSATGRGYRVERYAIETLPKDAVVDGNIADLDAVQSAVRSAWKRLGSSTRNVAVALPTSAVISKKITVPTGLREDELVGLVESEASQHIPFSMDEVSLDFQVVGPASDPDEEEVLIVATKRDRVEDRVAVAEAIGLHVLLVDVESNASLAASELVLGQLSELGSSSIVALVDIGMNVLRFSVLKNGAPIYSREQAFGGNQLTQDVARRFGMGYAEAEAGKRSGTLPEEYVTDLLPQFTENLALEVARSLQFFFTTTQFSRVDRIVLAGGCAAINGIAEQVAARTQVSTVIANPFAGMQISDKVRSSVLQSDAPALLNACGLALRSFNEGINLLPYRDEQLQARRQQFYVSAGLAAVLGVVIVFAGWMVNNLSLGAQQDINQHLEDEIGNSRKLVEEINDIRAQTQALLGRKTAIETLQKDRGDIVHLFNELVTCVPSGIYLTSLKQVGQEVTVDGYTQSNSRVSQFMRNIIASPWMDNPRLVTIKADVVNGRRQNSFTLKFALTAPAATEAAESPAEQSSVPAVKEAG